MKQCSFPIFQNNKTKNKQIRGFFGWVFYFGGKEGEGVMLRLQTWKADLEKKTLTLLNNRTAIHLFKFFFLKKEIMGNTSQPNNVGQGLVQLEKILIPELNHSSYFCNHLDMMHNGASVCIYVQQITYNP